MNIVDHGLFISGLIHQAAPGAQIRLVRVLNDYGVGDLRSILTAVDTVANHPDQLDIDPSQRIVVNMSLSFGPSASCLVGTWRQWDAIQKSDAQHKQPYAYNCVNDQANDGSSSLTAGGPAGKPGVYAGLTLPLSVAILDLANASNATRERLKEAPIAAVVAAAGNESKGLSPRLDADVPAAICGVVPVAALTYAGGAAPSLAAFSNTPSLSGDQCLNVAVSSSSVTVSLQGETRPSVSAAGGQRLWAIPATNPGCVAQRRDIVSGNHRAQRCGAVGRDVIRGGLGERLHRACWDAAGRVVHCA